LRGVRVDAGEVEVSGDQEDDGAHGFERAISPGSALGGLKQSVDGFEEPVGLTRLRLGDDAVEVIEDHLRHLFHRLDFGERWLHNFGRRGKWNFCLTTGTLMPANQERR
jgi:leucyl-tRNA synthetase